MLLRSRTTPTPGSYPDRVRVVLRWPRGLLRVTWRYMWRTTPMHRTEEPGDRDDLAPPLPDGALDDAVQPAEDGVGPLLHRRYSVVAENARSSPE